MGWCHNDFFQEAHLVYVTCMIPKLGKQLNWGNCCDHLRRHSEQCRREQKESKNFHDFGNALPERACEVKFFAAVMNDVQVPEKIDVMAPAMKPVSRKIQRDK